MRRAPEVGSTRQGRALATELVEEHGWNSTSYQVLDPGMRHWFSSAGDGLVAYAEVVGHRIVAGAPVTSESRLAAVASEFEEASRLAGRRVSYFGAEERFVSASDGRYSRHLIGYQPAWDASTWARRFDSDRSLRAQRNRAANKGVSARERPEADESADDLASCHAAWLASKRLPRLGFLAHSNAEGAGEHASSGRRLFVATLPGGRVGAYLTACPVPRRNGWLVDKVVRRPDAPNGTAELLIDAAARALADGSDRLTLGLAPLSGIVRSAASENEDAGVDVEVPAWIGLVERLAVRHGRRFYDFAGLYAFKRKFRPDAWEPVYLLSRDPRLSFGTMLAVAGAFVLA